MVWHMLLSEYQRHLECWTKNVIHAEQSRYETKLKWATK